MLRQVLFVVGFCNFLLEIPAAPEIKNEVNPRRFYKIWNNNIFLEVVLEILYLDGRSMSIFILVKSKSIPISSKENRYFTCWTWYFLERLTRVAWDYDPKFGLLLWFIELPGDSFSLNLCIPSNTIPYTREILTL